MHADHETLCTSRSWRATPWNYDSSIFLRFAPEGVGDATFAYGQTVYAVIRFGFELPEMQVLRLTYVKSPALPTFPGYSPGERAVKQLNYRLTRNELVGEEPNMGPFQYLWRLILGASPFPEDLRLPANPPLEYYGHDALGLPYDPKSYKVVDTR